MVNVAVIGASRVEAWRIIEARMTNNPDDWFSVRQIGAMVGVAPGTVEYHNAENLVYQLVRDGVLVFAGKKGKRVYQLTDKTYVVAQFVSGRR